MSTRIVKLEKKSLDDMAAEARALRESRMTATP